MTAEEYNQALIERHGLEIYTKLKNSKVAIAGLGGLGSNVAIALARAGVGEILLVDFDNVDITNLNRQQYFISDIGKPKTQALTSIIRSLNPVIKISSLNQRVTEENALEIFKDYPLVCECFDKAENKAMLINTLLSQSENITIISGSGMAGIDSSNTITTTHPMERLYLCGDRVSDVNKGLGLISARVGICAMHQANMTLRLLLGIKEI